MDPNATLAMIESSAYRDYEEADARCWDLMIWIEHGGFQPDWTRYQKGTRYYREFKSATH